MNSLLKRDVIPERDETISRKVVDAIAEAEGVDPIELPPLFNVIDPDALEALYSPSGHGPARDGGWIVFPYYGYEVLVTCEGDVRIREAVGNDCRPTPATRDTW